MITIINSIKNRYSLFGLIKLLGYLIYTKVFYPGQRIIRPPFEIRGSKMINLGKNLTTGKYCRIEAFLTGNDDNKKITFGENVQLNDNVHISALLNVTIGDDVLMASNIYISDNSHGLYTDNQNATSPEISPAQRPYMVSPVIIGNRVWIGEGTIIMPGVNIGNGAVIGAHSIVKSDIPDNSIAVGSPARVIKEWDSQSKKWKRL